MSKIKVKVKDGEVLVFPGDYSISIYNGTIEIFRETMHEEKKRFGKKKKTQHWNMFSAKLDNLLYIRREL